MHENALQNGGILVVYFVMAAGLAFFEYSTLRPNEMSLIKTTV